MSSATTVTITEVDKQLEHTIVDSIKKVCTSPVVQGIWSGNQIFSIQHANIGMLQLFSYGDILSLINQGYNVDSAVDYLTRHMPWRV